MAGFEAVIASKPDISFDEILEITGAGKTCTACLLDLEYNFVSVPRPEGGKASRSAFKKGRADRKSLKRRVFDFLDRVSPARVFPSADRVPIINARGVQQRVWVANRSMLFEKEFCGPPMELELSVFGSDGTLLHKRTVVLEPESTFSFLASDYLAPPASDDRMGITVGSVEIVRRGLKPGYRGTTRPQTEIVARNGACNVHGQAFKIAGEYWFGTDFRPDSERIFLTFMNFSADPLSIDVAYPVTPDPKPQERCHEFVIPGNGTAIHEITLTDAERDNLETEELAIRWRTTGDFNCYALCATPDLSNFSIDHV
tara:strand:+ start:1589 stop:2530 length:942 start_codon:yes stop_codon:yes gene_type:complete